MECIILAGGLGTRLRGVIGDMPKCMAPVAGKPFLHYLFRYMAGQGISRVVLALGYRSEAVIDWLRGEHWPFAVEWVIEEQPLGTGGGIQLALGACKAQDVFVLNGDTMFRIDLDDLLGAHRRNAAETSIALKAMQRFDRYGTVVTDDAGRILSFEEKKPKDSGNINGGIYVIAREAFLGRGLPEKCSFEQDYLERFAGEGRFYGHAEGSAANAYFIDIGVPQDYDRAQQDFKTLFPEQ